MRIRTVLAAASLLSLSLVARPAWAQEAKTVCKDGTTSNATGRGACSSHGGVASKGTASAAKTTKGEAKSAEQAGKPDAKAASKAAKSETKAAEKTAKSETKAAEKTAKTEAKAEAKTEAKDVTCTDGTTSKGGRGACSGHGGVKKAKKG
jgi:hypothetical protein